MGFEQKVSSSMEEMKLASMKSSLTIARQNQRMGNEPAQSPESWDPMNFQSNSIANLNCYDVQSAVAGMVDLRGTICPHADSSGGCYKGSRCPHRYHIDQKRIAEDPRMGIPVVPQFVSHFNKLDKQLVGISGMIFQGSVTYMVSPSEFFIVPSNPLTCTCTSSEEPVEDQLTKMMKELEVYYSRHQFRNATSFAMNELLAVRHGFREQIRYFRAVALEELCLEDEKPPAVKCFLMDIGKIVEVSLFDVGPLPRLYCHQPPLVYKCSLYGFEPPPLDTKYPSKVIRRFGSLINWKPAIFIVRRLSDSNTCRSLPWLSRPIEVEMRVSLDEENPLVYTNVKDKLPGGYKRVNPSKHTYTDTQLDLLFHDKRNSLVTVNNLLQNDNLSVTSVCPLCHNYVANTIS